MNSKNIRNRVLSLLSLSLILILSACGSKASVESTEDANAIYTAAAETVQAQLTQQAVLNPTATNTPAPTITLAPIPTLPPVVTQPPVAAQPTTAPTTPPVSTAPDKYSYIGQNPADDTQIPANQAFDMVWTVENSGTTTWTKAYSLVFFIGDRLAPSGRSNVYTLKNDVKPGERYDLTVDMVTPPTPGTYTSWWKLKNAEGQNFGDVTITIKVGAAVVVPTGTPTLMPTP